MRTIHGRPDDLTGPLNLGNPQEVSIIEIAHRIIDLTRSNSRIEWRPLPRHDPKQRCPDIGLARRALEWEPTVPLEEGLRRTIDYFESLLREGGAPPGAHGRPAS